MFSNQEMFYILFTEGLTLYYYVDVSTSITVIKKRFQPYHKDETPT
jgi:hypothetical protein